MVATSNGRVHGSMHMYEVVCVLCTEKLEDKASRINVQGYNSFPIEDELKTFPINVIIDDSSCMLFLSSHAEQEKVLRGTVRGYNRRARTELWKYYYCAKQPCSNNYP